MRSTYVVLTSEEKNLDGIVAELLQRLTCACQTRPQ